MKNLPLNTTKRRFSHKKKKWEEENIVGNRQFLDLLRGETDFLAGLGLFLSLPRSICIHPGNKLYMLRTHEPISSSLSAP